MNQKYLFQTTSATWFGLQDNSLDSLNLFSLNYPFHLFSLAMWRTDLEKGA